MNIPVGEPVDLEICRGYPLIIDPANRIITESVYDSSQPRDRELFEITIVKGNEGFGFTIADNPNVSQFDELDGDQLRELESLEGFKNFENQRA